MTTILQITDPHLMSDRQGILNGIPPLETLATVLDDARDRCPDPACIVWTGDLSHEESVAGYQLLREIAGDWIEKSHLIPGNHDDRAALREVFPEIDGEGDEMVSFQTELGTWQLVGLDTLIPGDDAGALSEEQLDQLHDWLTPDPGRPTLVFMHHPPVPVGCPWLDEIGLHNPDSLEKLLSRSRGVRGVFCGHVHHVHEGMFAGARVFTAPSAAFQFKVDSLAVAFDMIPPGFRLITLHDEVFTTEVYRCANLEYRPSEDRVSEKKSRIWSSHDNHPRRL